MTLNKLKKLSLLLGVVFEAHSYTGIPIDNLRDLQGEIPRFHRPNVNEMIPSTQDLGRVDRIRGAFNSAFERDNRLVALLHIHTFKTRSDDNEFIQSQIEEDKETYRKALYGRKSTKHDFLNLGAIGREAALDPSSLGTLPERVMEQIHAEAREGNIASLYNLGLIYAQYNDPTAVTYFKLTAKAGFAPALVVLADIFKGGLLKEEKNPFLAEKLYEIFYKIFPEHPLAEYAANLGEEIAKKYDERESRIYAPRIKVAGESGIEQAQFIRAAAHHVRSSVKYDKRKETALKMIPTAVSSVLKHA